MKKVFIMLLTLLTLSAQGAKFGVKAGLNNATNSQGSSSTSGLTAGAMLNLDLALLNIDVEALYTNIAPETGTFTYLHIPATVRLSLLPTVFARAGVQYENILTVEDDNGNDLKSGTNNGLSIILGAGVSLDLPAIPGLIIDARYSIPLYNTTDKDLSKGIVESKVNNFQLTVGILF